ncbi:Hypothetical predicted protein [Paramuricea clavata]|uniref:Mutator-like transposase domain-containing protein n=1 Tax=Paramuricea clavata TaxID=317549 RepID=A0A6S7H0T8_PARCT|nr:Hypothetical predicted protein [Paramuricea clavata]
MHSYKSQQNAITQDRVINNEDLVTVKSTSARKLENASSELPQTPEFTRQNSQEKDGYRIVYIENIRKAVEMMHKCKNGTIITCEDASKRAGLSSSYYFECTKCRQGVDMDTSKPVEGKACSFDVNRRTNFAMGELGLGREALATICEILNMPPPVSDSAYQKHNRSVNLATRKVLEERLNDAGHRVRTFLQKDDAEILDVAVSFDGTWSKRGFTANYGVGIVISADTGEVLDYVVLSKVCELCKAAEKHKSNRDKYQEWKDAHAASGLCQKNYNGSSPAMEKEAARILWSRSVEKHKFRYIDMVCDSKAYGEVWDIYGVCDDCEKYENMDKQSAEYQKWLKSKAHANWEREHSTSNENCHRVSKLDCVGHVPKRMGKNLIALSGKSKLADGKPVGGRNIMAMPLDGVLYHSVKIVDEKKRHQYCPDGEGSWCSFKRDKAVGTNTPFLDKSHHLDPVFLEFLIPLFDRLSEKKLLKRCLPGLSQNANESVNSLVWNRCPKHRNRGIKYVETAAASAIMQFNIGAAGRHGVMKELEISGGYYTKAGSGKKNKKRVKQANARAQKKFKEARQKIRQAKLVEEARLKALEGVTYQSAAFNEDNFNGSRKRKTDKTTPKEGKSKQTRKE